MNQLAEETLINSKNSLMAISKVNLKRKLKSQLDLVSSNHLL